MVAVLYFSVCITFCKLELLAVLEWEADKKWMYSRSVLGSSFHSISSTCPVPQCSNWVMDVIGVILSSPRQSLSLLYIILTNAFANIAHFYQTCKKPSAATTVHMCIWNTFHSYKCSQLGCFYTVVPVYAPNFVKQKLKDDFSSMLCCHHHQAITALYS